MSVPSIFSQSPVTDSRYCHFASQLHLLRTPSSTGCRSLWTQTCPMEALAGRTFFTMEATFIIGDQGLHSSHFLTFSLAAILTQPPTGLCVFSITRFGYKSQTSPNAISQCPSQALICSTILWLSSQMQLHLSYLHLLLQIPKRRTLDRHSSPFPAS